MKKMMLGRSGGLSIRHLVSLGVTAAVALFSSCVVAYDPLTLEVASVGASSATLQFAQPGVQLDDGTWDHATSYALRCSMEMDLPFESMTELPPELVPPATLERGLMIQVTIPDLIPGATYEFAMRAIYIDPDGLENWAESNHVRATIKVDQVPPAVIDDLTATGAGDDAIELRWTAAGDDGMTGTAQRYDLRYSSDGPIEDEAAFAAATAVPTLPPPAEAGKPQGVTVGGLAPLTTYHFSIRAVDKGGNPGPLSPFGASATTLEHVPGGGGSGAKGGCAGSAGGDATFVLASLLALGLAATLRRA